MAKPKPELSLTESLAQTRLALQQTLALAKARQRARKMKATPHEREEIERLAELLWTSHTEAAGIAYRVRR